MASHKGKIKDLTSQIQGKYSLFVQHPGKEAFLSPVVKHGKLTVMGPRAQGVARLLDRKFCHKIDKKG